MFSKDDREQNLQLALVAQFYDLLQKFSQQNIAIDEAQAQLLSLCPNVPDVELCLASPPANAEIIFKTLASHHELVNILLALCDVNSDIITRKFDRVDEGGKLISYTLLELFLKEKTTYQSSTILQWVKGQKPELLNYAAGLTGEISYLQQELIFYVKEQQLHTFNQKLRLITSEQFKDIIEIDDGSFIGQIILCSDHSFLMSMVNFDIAFSKLDCLQENGASLLLSICKRLLAEDPGTLDSINERYLISSLQDTPVSSSDEAYDTAASLSSGQDNEDDADAPDIELLALAAVLASHIVAPTYENPNASSHSELLSHIDIENYQLGPALPEEYRSQVNLGLVNSEILDAFAHEKFWPHLAGRGFALLPTITNSPRQGLREQIEKLKRCEPTRYTTSITINHEIVLSAKERPDLKILPHGQEKPLPKPPTHALWIVSEKKHYGLFGLNLSNNHGFYIEPFSQFPFGLPLVILEKERIIADSLSSIIQELNLDPRNIQVVQQGQLYGTDNCSDYVIGALALMANGLIDPSQAESLLSLEGRYLTEKRVQEIRWCEIFAFPGYFEIQQPPHQEVAAKESEIADYKPDRVRSAGAPSQKPCKRFSFMFFREGNIDSEHLSKRLRITEPRKVEHPYFLRTWSVPLPGMPATGLASSADVGHQSPAIIVSA